MADGKKSRTTVEIYGQQYKIVADESKSHVKMVASLVDEKMKELKEMNSTLDVNKLAVLTAVNAVNDYLLLEQKYIKLVESIQKEEENEQ